MPMLLDEPLGLIVERLRRRGTDDASVEVKACTNKLSADVWETVSAFANTAGWTHYFGPERSRRICSFG